MDRREKLVQHLDLTGGRGLEIGPLMSPVVTPDVAEIYYVDHASTEELRAKYRDDPAVDETRISEVDFVWGEQTMLETTASKAPFDWAIASHVLEHVPDLSGWLHEISSVLTPGGRLSLVMPDRRFTFDVRRRPSDISDVVEAALVKYRRPSIRSTFDHFYRHVDVDTYQLWHAQPGHSNPPFNAKTAMELATISARDHTYVDTHCWVFSDREFLELIRRATELELVDMKITAFVPTTPVEFEFFVTFERLADGLSSDERKAQCLAALDAVDSMEFPKLLNEADEADEASDQPAGVGMRVSVREQHLIEAKRKALGSVRSLISRYR